MPGHLTSFKVGGHFGAKGSSLNDRGAGDPKRRFNYASERSRSGTWSHHRHTESCKPNKTKQNKTDSLDGFDLHGFHPLQAFQRGQRTSTEKRDNWVRKKSRLLAEETEVALSC